MAPRRIHDLGDVTLQQVALTNKFAGCCRKPGEILARPA
jgi:hypothetical protein